jgi:ATP-dependent Clp protease adaptor protein ClpS
MKKEQLQKRISLKRSRDNFNLVLINDDVNTFEHVIKSLVEVCGHDEYQAEQCATITHFKGKCDIKIGSKAILQAMSKNLKARGLKTKVESQ